MELPARSPAFRLAILPLLAACLSSCGAPSDFSPPAAPSYPVPGDFSALHGAAVIEEGDFVARADSAPWSGYWYPLSRIDARSALEKYDRLSGRRALEAEEQRLRTEGRPYQPWEGRCDAWAFASILIPEPRAPLVVEQGGILERFSVAEQKALWIHSHEVIDPASRTVYGTRNDGDGTTPFEDISPAEFHRVLQIRLQRDRKPFIMDRDPRPAVWNSPVHGAHWTIRRDAAQRDLFHVHAWVEAVFPHDSDLDGNDRLVTVLEYTYDLEAHPAGGSGFVVHGSRWTGGSVRDHPDFVTVLKDSVEDSAEAGARSANPELDIDWLRQHLRPAP